MTKTETKVKPKTKKASFKEALLKSSIGNRISPTKLEALLSLNADKEEVLVSLVKQLSTIFPMLGLKEFKEITTDLNKLIDLK